MGFEFHVDARVGWRARPDEIGMRSLSHLISNDDQPSWPATVAGPILYVRTVHLVRGGAMAMNR
ncbi:hypothetical protein, partial [Thauera aromatica]|uniref:hypothetical protein n=1 Tax=Thauera aromatica TaxID=59405 RepID=UPI001FFD4A45